MAQSWMPGFGLALLMCVCAGCSSTNDVSPVSGKNGDWHCIQNPELNGDWHCGTASASEVREIRKVLRAEQQQERAARQQQSSSNYQLPKSETRQPTQLPSLSAEPVVDEPKRHIQAPVAETSFTAETPRPEPTREEASSGYRQPPDSRPAKPTPAPTFTAANDLPKKQPAQQSSTTGFVLQLGAFSDEFQAWEAARNWGLSDVLFRIEDVLSNGKYLFVLIYGEYATRQEAIDAGDSLKDDNPQIDYWVRSKASLAEADKAAG